MTQVPTLLLIHGAWCGGWVWEPLLGPLRERGVRFSVVEQLPSAGRESDRLGDLQADVACVRARLSEMDGPVVLCGHSYAGVVMTEVADHPAIARSIYVAAFWPSRGQSLLNLVGGQPPDWIIVRDDGSLAIVDDVERARDVLFADLDPSDAAQVHERLVSQSAPSFLAPCGAPARSHPSTYVVCTDDQAIPGPLQEAMSAPADDVVRLRSAHFVQFSQPEQLADVLAASVAVPVGG